MKVLHTESLPRHAMATIARRNVRMRLTLRRIAAAAILLLCGGAVGAAAVLFAGCNRDYPGGWGASEEGLSPDDRPRPAVAAPLRPVRSIDRAVIISIDGLRPDLLARAEVRNLRWLMRSGSFSLWAATVPVAVTLPSHTSMLTGVRPEVHGVTWNGDKPGAYPRVPTLFQLARQAGLTTAMATGKTKFSALAAPASLDWSSIRAAGDRQVTDEAIGILRRHRPNLLFVHLPGPDVAGHTYGWGSPQQIDAVQHADAQVGRLLDTLSDLGLTDSTFLLVSADHGGTGLSHGGPDPRSRTIPWIAAGPGVRRNYDLTREPRLRVRTEDTFATVSMMLGLPQSSRVQGRPVVQILAERGELMYETLAAP
jgi:Type I phosphodiesterase / nucleotide pyrophosphatase